jgi:hypothetical protein
MHEVMENAATGIKKMFSFNGSHRYVKVLGGCELPEATSSFDFLGYVHEPRPFSSKMEAQRLNF